MLRFQRSIAAMGAVSIIIGTGSRSRLTEAANRSGRDKGNDGVNKITLRA
jgi:hypothetical protein